MNTTDSKARYDVAVLDVSTDGYYNQMDPVGKTSVSTFAPTESQWESGENIENEFTGKLPGTSSPDTKIVNLTAFADNNNLYYSDTEDPTYDSEELKRLRVPDSVDELGKPQVLTRPTVWADDKKRAEILNEDKSLIQNNYSYPHYISNSSGINPAKYDYAIIPGDSRYPKMVSLEDKLQTMRASLGLQVHGNNDIARAVKYYMYNRFKVPDTNLAFNRMTTHVFFTRPDLNILKCKGSQVYGPAPQVNCSTEASLLYNTNPYLFKLLTDGDRCGDRNNFNLLLSQQISSFDTDDENISTAEVGKSYDGSAMVYGDGFDIKGPGEFRCSFTELQDLSIIKMMKLWIMYIANVSSGVWSPSYDLNGNAWPVTVNTDLLRRIPYDKVGKTLTDSHVYSKTLDYAASAYVFKCGPNGDDVLYWTKYYGVFPVNTGASALSWHSSDNIGEPPRLNIQFKYMFKRDLSPISLIEFNDNAGIPGILNSSEEVLVAESSYNPNYNHSSRPFVGTPFISMYIDNVGKGHNDEVVKYNKSLGQNADMFGRSASHIKLKFMKSGDYRLSDELLYRSDLSSRR